MEKVTGHMPMREIEIFGIPALFTEQDITTAETPPRPALLPAYQRQ